MFEYYTFHSEYTVSSTPEWYGLPAPVREYLDVYSWPTRTGFLHVFITQAKMFFSCGNYL
jgi:hypothetical protein